MREYALSIIAQEKMKSFQAEAARCHLGQKIGRRRLRLFLMPLFKFVYRAVGKLRLAGRFSEVKSLRRISLYIPHPE
jgi:hypothetical protein